jgi:hypothetical protein
MQAPDFTLEHIAGQRMSLSEFVGTKPVVLVFAGKPVAEQAEAINKVIGGVLLDDVQLISVMHVAGVPRMARPLAKRSLRKTFEMAAKDAEADRRARGMPMGDPARTIVMLLDWEGAVSELYGVSDPNREAMAILVGREGDIQAQAAGPEAGRRILSHLTAT